MKVLLIVSQYYYSRHCFVVKYDSETFKKKATECIKELESNKRHNEDGSEFRFGDLDSRWYHEDRRQHNVNDHSGDIYFIVCNSVSEAIKEVRYYDECSRIGSKGYQKKDIKQAISKHHNYEDIRNIIYNHFEIS